MILKKNIMMISMSIREHFNNLYEIIIDNVLLLHIRNSCVSSTHTTSKACVVW